MLGQPTEQLEDIPKEVDGLNQAEQISVCQFFLGGYPFLWF